MKQDRGFSLVEMLVVIAIIAIVVALVFPLITGAKESAKITHSANNLKQIYVGHALYANDNGSLIVPYPLSSESMVQYWARQAGYPADQEWAWKHRELIDNYVRSPDVWYCPSDANARKLSYPPIPTYEVYHEVSSYRTEIVPRGVRLREWLDNPNRSLLLFCSIDDSEEECSPTIVGEPVDVSLALGLSHNRSYWSRRVRNTVSRFGNLEVEKIPNPR